MPNSEFKSKEILQLGQISPIHYLRPFMTVCSADRPALITSKALHKLDADSAQSVRDEEDVRSGVICVRVGEISCRIETSVEQIVNEKAGAPAVPFTRKDRFVSQSAQ